MSEQRERERQEPRADAREAWATSRQQRAEHRHRVRALGITRGLDVRVLVDIDPGADRDARREALRAVRDANPDQRLGVRAHLLTEAFAQVRQGAAVLELE